MITLIIAQGNIATRYVTNLLIQQTLNNKP